MEAAVTSVRALFDYAVSRSVCLPSGEPGPSADTWVAGGFARIRVDVPLAPTLYANQQGGFRVTCPHCAQNVVPMFANVLAVFRATGDADMVCPHCGETTPISQLHYAPPAAVGRAALAIGDAGSGTLRDGIVSDLQERFGPVTVVAARVSAR